MSHTPLHNQSADDGGWVTSIRGSVVDVRFAGALPAVRELLRAESGVQLEVSAHIDDDTARCLAFGGTDGIARGARVTPTGAPLTVTVGSDLLGRVVDVFGDAIDGGELGPGWCPERAPPWPVSAAKPPSPIGNGPWP